MLQFTSARHPGRRVLALLAATLLMALATMQLPGQAQAAIYSYVELSASSSYGSFSVFSGGPSEFREARSPEPVALRATLYRNRNGVESTSTATMKLKLTVTFWCGRYAGGSTGSYPIEPVSAHYTWHPETLCPGEELYEAVLTGYAYDPTYAHYRTAQLEIAAYGPQVPEDMLPTWKPW
jgi:hypothetical protein